MFLPNLVEGIIFIFLMVIVAWSWFKDENSVWKSLLFTVFTCFIFYLNVPNFISIGDNSTVKFSPLILPFYLYNYFGTIYVIITNILLACVGLYLGKPKNSKFSRKKAKKQFDNYVEDASELKIIGRDLNFLLETDGSKYKTQRKKIRSLGKQSKILCCKSNELQLIELYNDLLKDGIQIRSYVTEGGNETSNGITYLRGQIKTDGYGVKTGLFVSKMPSIDGVNGKFDDSSQYEFHMIKNSYLVDAVDKQFDKTFSSALNPVIRCIALDLGGVYFDGDIDNFYSYLQDEYGISINKKGNDRLNIDDDLTLGKITIQKFIENRCSSKKLQRKLKPLNDEDWEKILAQWQNTWHPNDKIKQLISRLNQFGYIIVPFSNLDKQNGEKYIRDHYLPDCCPAYYFSYEKGKAKPGVEAFEDFAQFVENKRYIYKPCQILLIDDEIENVNTATSLGWSAIQFYNNSENSVADLIQKLIEKNILPENFTL